MNKSLKIRGFTLVELLVVISIIGLLAGLAVPAINGALKKAKSGACLSNLRQIGLALITYASGSEDGRFPVPDDGKALSNEATWVKKLDIDAKTKKNIFVCPGCEKPVKEGTGEEVAITYGVYSALVDPSQNFPINSIVRPSDVILVADVCQETENKGWSPNRIEEPSIFLNGGGDGMAMGEDMDTPLPPGDDADGPKKASLRYRHQGRVNVVMVDGHAESIKKGEVLNKHAVLSQ